MDKDDFLKQLGHNIKTIRESKGISQQQLAAECNFEKSNMSRIEAGRTNPTIFTLYKIALALNISLEEIITTI